MSLSMVLPPMYPRSPPTAGRNLEISQPGKDLPTNLNQFIQPLLQVLHVGGIDPTIFIGGFGVLIQVVAAHLQEICHALQTQSGSCVLSDRQRSASCLRFFMRWSSILRIEFSICSDE